VAGRLTIIGGGVMGLDTCWYDLVADDEFILGAVPGTDDVFTGVGWRGAGYKFAPWVGKVLAQLAVQRGTVYDIGRFTPAGSPAARRASHWPEVWRHEFTVY
jgi:glycine/D-amino acid oxidase-like deaminating enzyme